MIITRGYWNCFHCGKEHPNRVLICDGCNNSRKHTENMRKTLGMDAKPYRLADKEDKNRYNVLRGKLEKFLPIFFSNGLTVRGFKDRDDRCLCDSDTLYYGFDFKGYHYTIRRDKI